MVHVPVVVKLNDSRRLVLTMLELRFAQHSPVDVNALSFADVYTTWSSIILALGFVKIHLTTVVSIKTPPTRHDQRVQPAILRNDFLVLDGRLWKSSQITLTEQKECVSVFPSITPAGTELFHLSES